MNEEIYNDKAELEQKIMHLTSEFAKKHGVDVFISVNVEATKSYIEPNVYNVKINETGITTKINH